MFLFFESLSPICQFLKYVTFGIQAKRLQGICYRAFFFPPLFSKSSEKMVVKRPEMSLTQILFINKPNFYLRPMAQSRVF